MVLIVLALVTKAMPIHFLMNGKCHTKQLKSGKSYKPCLTNNYTWSITPGLLHHLILMAAGADTHMHTYT